MCGRYVRKTGAQEIAHAFSAVESGQYLALNFNISGMGASTVNPTWATAPLAASTSGVTTGILFTQTLSPLLEGKLLNLTNGLVFGAGMMKDVGICTLGNVVGTADDINFRPGMTWYCTMLVTDAAGSALIATNGIPDAMNAASLGAKTVNSLFLSETAAIMPAFVTAALRIEKLGLVERIASKDDRRVNMVYLTDAAKPLQEATYNIANQTMNEALQGISKEEIEIVKSVFQRVYENSK